MRILVAEDEKDLNQVISKHLQREGYSVDSCYTGEDALTFLESGTFDVAILDVMMPLLSGFDVLRNIRQKNISTPVLLLTAKDSVQDKVYGLDIGADDYMVKPFSFDELLARLRVLTRQAAGARKNVLTVEDLVLNIKTRTVTRAGQIIQLSAKEYEILAYMMRNAGTVLTRKQIEDHAWSLDYTGGTNAVDVYIRYLRKKIDECHKTKLIQTIRGVGYTIRSSL